MDLFGDLPEPETEGEPNNGGSQTTKDVIQGISGKSSSVSNGKESTSTVVGDKRKLTGGGDAETEEKKKLMKKPCKFCMKGYVADRQGEREDMQDSHLIQDNFHLNLTHLNPSIHRLSIYAVFDGHGGVRASRFASQHLHNNLRDRFPKGDITQVEKEIKKSLIEAFKKTDEDFLKEARKNKPSWKDGTTAVMVVGINDTLYIANLGDSKAVLCRYKESEGKHVAIPLTTDHNPSVYDERMRIQKAGGYVKDGRVMGQLEVARSLGDGPYKNHGVTCVPDVKRCQLTEHDRFLLIACDGLWKQFSAEESVNQAVKLLEGKDGQMYEDGRFELTCGQLASAAVLRLSGDNVTVMMVAITDN